MRGRSFGRFCRLFAGVAMLTLGVEARAGFTITLESVTGSGPYTFVYSASITGADQVRAGDFFRIYDFYGLVPGSVVAPTGWSVAVQDVTATPPPNVFVPLGDDPAIPNLIFTYDGATPIDGATVIPGFRADSVFNDLGTVKNFVGRSTQAGGPTAGMPVDVVGDVRVPGVPEPASLVSAALGGLILTAFASLRSRRARGR